MQTAKKREGYLLFALLRVSEFFAVQTAYLSGETQLKLAASLMSPLPLYLETFG